MPKRIDWFLVLILCLALVLRVISLDYLELFGDEIDAGYQSYSLLKTLADYKGHVFPFYGQSFSEWRALGWMYMAMPFIQIFGLNEWGVRLTSAVFGLISIGLVWLILKDLKVRQDIVRYSLLFLAISPWHIQYSRAGFELTVMSTWVLLGVWLLIKSLTIKSSKWLISAGLTFGLALYTYNTANIFVPLICLTILIIYKASLKNYLVLGLTGLIICMPLLYQILFGHAGDRFKTMSVFSHKDIVAEVDEYRNAAGNNLWSKVFYNKAVIGGKRILFNYTNAFSGEFLFRTGDVTFRHSLHKVGNLYWVQLPLLVFGVVYVLKFKKDNRVKLLLMTLLLAPIPSSLTIDGFNHASRLFLMVFPLSIISAVGMVSLKKGWKYLILLGLIFEFTNYQLYYWNFYKNESWRWWHSGYKSAMIYVANNKQNYKKVLIDNTYEPALVRYLFWNQINPKTVRSIDDRMNQNIDGFDGFCISDNSCFVDFKEGITSIPLNKEVLYLVSHERSIGGDWDFSKNPSEGVEVLETIRNSKNEPIFYLLKGR